MEFSVAAYRFGHSMIRPQYKLNPDIERPIFADDGDDLGGFRPIPAGWAIDWQLFIDLGHDAKPAPQLSYKIDTSLAHPLGHLPAGLPRIHRAWRCATSSAARPSSCLLGSRWPGHSG